MGMGDVARGRDARGRWREVLLPRSNGELDGSMGESISLGSWCRLGGCPRFTYCLWCRSTLAGRHVVTALMAHHA